MMNRTNFAAKASVLLTSALLISAPAFAQDTTAPAEAPAVEPVTPPPAVTPAPLEAAPATTAVFPAPEGYSPVSDWTTITAKNLVGTNLYNGTGDSIGEISDIALDTAGAVTGIIVDVGGFLGIGAHTVNLAVDQLALYSNAEGALAAYTALDETALKALPAYVPPAQ